MSERIEKYRKTLSDARAFWDSVLDQVGDRWETQIYSDGMAWTVRQIVNHVADADRGHNFQVMSIAEGQNPIPEDFDLERYNNRLTEKTIEKSAEQSRTELAETRTQLNQWLDTLDEAKLDNKGRHASLNILSVAQILRVMANHEIGHAQDIAAVLGIPIPAQEA
ncbi:MAG: hypothetical protein GFH27_549395n71 [Chloroflexi bacterium AL-W]|nr:hypothetical protein [Chloroflexi bacterium AL-W]